MIDCCQIIWLPTSIARQLVAVALTMPLLFGGCIAFNIPSVRYDDPDDRGGMLGPQQKRDPAELAVLAEQHRAGSRSCLGGTVVNDLNIDEVKAEQPPEVPWPRFHPLPTRPVFSAPL